MIRSSTELIDRLFTHQVITPLNTEGKPDPDGLMPIGLI